MNPVLVVDDDESYRELVVLTLEDHCGVERVHDFAAGGPLLQHLETSTEAPPVLALLDLHMPDMDGLQLLHEIRRRAPQLPVAFLSGAAEAREREACLAAGAIAFLLKPVAYADLVSSLHALIHPLST
jgi:CheY-like chemotaxis protein